MISWARDEIVVNSLQPAGADVALGFLGTLNGTVEQHHYELPLGSGLDISPLVNVCRGHLLVH